MTTLPPFYPILDIGVIESRGMTVLAAAKALIEAGVHILQWRYKGEVTRERFEELRRLSELCGRSGVTLVVNDRCDIAALLGLGAHVGQDDLSPAKARSILGEQALLGFSTHDERQFDAALRQPIDYVAAGPIFTTTTKLNPDPVLGVERLASLPRNPDCPLVAIGGITRDNAQSVLYAGADAVAVISDLYPEPLTPDTLRARTREWLNLVQP